MKTVAMFTYKNKHVIVFSNYHAFYYIKSRGVLK